MRTRWSVICIALALPCAGQLQQAELIPSDVVANQYFGSSLSISGDTAVVGAPDQPGVNDPGSAYVFVRNGVNWILQAKLTAADGLPVDGFGYSVSVNGDTMLIGAPNNNAKGAAYVFIRNGTNWTLQQKLTLSDRANGDRFGTSVSVSGNLAVIGAPGKNAAYTFARSGTTWVQQQKLTASDGGGSFGYSVSVSGNTALIGAHDFGVPSITTQQGAAYVFGFNGTTWAQQQELTASDGTSIDWFGWSVSLSGGTAVIGAYQKGFGPSSDHIGRAYVFVRTGSGAWTQQQELVAPDAAPNNGFGYSVSVSGDTAVIGSWYRDNSFFGGGEAYVFVRGAPAGPWVLQQRPSSSDWAAADGFGSSVAVSGDLVVIGAPFHGTGPRFHQGTAYVYPTIQAVSVMPSSGAGPAQTFSGLFVDPVGASDIQVVYLDFGSSIFAAHSCIVAYVQANSALYLFNDTNSSAAGPITAGSSGTLSNSQCTLSGSGGAGSAAAKNLTIPLAITFANGFTGSHNVYGLAQNYSGVNGEWQMLGTWTTGLGAASVSPIDGGGVGAQTFNALYTDPNGASDLQVVYLDFGPSTFAPHSCVVAYVQASNMLYLYNDAGTGALGPILEGTGSTLSNSQCTISGSGGPIALSGKNLTVPISITFLSGFNGKQNVWGLAQQYNGTQSGWQLLGTWVTGLAAISVTPTNGGGLGPQTFTAMYVDARGSSDVQVVYLDFGSSIFAPNSCIVGYIPFTQEFFLLNDGSNGTSGVGIGAGQIGGSATTSNNQCTLSGLGGRIPAGPLSVTVPFAITFANTFTGSKSVWGLVQSYNGPQSGWQMLGTWTP